MKKEINVLQVSLPLHLDGDGHFEYQGKEWNNSTLYTACIGIEEFDFPLCAIDMSNKPWGMTNFIWILYHIKRIESADIYDLYTKSYQLIHNLSTQHKPLSAESFILELKDKYSVKLKE